jgi:SAM-dependent methyltransferase
MNNYLNVLNDIIIDHPDWKPGYNLASNDFYQEHVQHASIQYWRDTFMPHATALFPLQRTENAGRWFPDGKVDQHAMDIFVNAIDSIAIRSRGAIHNQIVLDAAISSDQTEFSAVALGAGAGVPNINATTKVRDEAGKRFKWKMYDLSYDSLEKSEELFIEAGVPAGDVEVYRADYRKAFKLEAESQDVVDMLGLWEYLPSSRCVEAVAECYQLLKPGGVFVFSNMLPDRPQLEVNTTVIGWPGVKPRSVDELIDIVAAAGLDTKDVRVTVPDDGVYAVLEIHKP